VLTKDKVTHCDTALFKMAAVCHTWP